MFRHTLGVYPLRMTALQEIAADSLVNVLESGMAMVEVYNGWLLCVQYLYIHLLVIFPSGNSLSSFMLSPLVGCVISVDFFLKISLKASGSASPVVSVTMPVFIENTSQVLIELRPILSLCAPDNSANLSSISSFGSTRKRSVS